MNFTPDLKNDLYKYVSDIATDKQERFAFLCALTKMRGGIDVYKKSISLTYELDSAADVTNIARLLKEH